MSAGTDIAANVEAALREAGEATGNDAALICTLERQYGGSDDPRSGPADNKDRSELVALDFPVQIRDQSGTLIGRTVRTLTVNATGEAPEKNDRIAVGVLPADVTTATTFHRIIAVRPLAPTGIALLYELEIED